MRDSKGKFIKGHTYIPLTQEGLNKIISVHKGKKRPGYIYNDVWREKQRAAKLGKKHPRVPGQQEKIANARRGKKYPNISITKIGEKNPQWRGGKTFEKYPKEWNEKLRSAVRERDGNRCQLCGKREDVFKNMAVHHIDYDKKNCHFWNLITLCCRCHISTNTNREYWIRFFKNRTDMMRLGFYYGRQDISQVSAYAANWLDSICVEDVLTDNKSKYEK